MNIELMGKSIYNLQLLANHRPSENIWVFSLRQSESGIEFLPTSSKIIYNEANTAYDDSGLLICNSHLGEARAMCSFGQMLFVIFWEKNCILFFL